LLPTVIATENLYLSGTGIDVTGALRNVRGDANPAGSNDNTWRGRSPSRFSPASRADEPGSRVAIGVTTAVFPASPTR